MCVLTTAFLAGSCCFVRRSKHEARVVGMLTVGFDSEFGEEKKCRGEKQYICVVTINCVHSLSCFKYIQNPLGLWGFNYTLNKSL